MADDASDRRLLIYLALVFVLGWAWIFGVLLGLDPELNFFTLLPVTLVPAVATVLAVLVTDRARLGEVFGRALAWGSPRRGLLLVGVAVVVAAVAAILSVLASPNALASVSAFGGDALGVIALIVLGILAGFGSQFGWVVSVFTPLQSRFGPTLAAVVTGSLAAVWALPLYLLPGWALSEGATVAELVASTVLVVVSTAWVCVLAWRAEGSIVPGIAYAAVFATVDEVFAKLFPFGGETSWGAIGVLVVAIAATLARRPVVAERATAPVGVER